MFINTLWNDNVDDYVCVYIEKIHWRFIWAKCFFNQLTKIKWSFEFLKYGKMLSNKGF